MYTALYRSFRPEVFDEILGQEHIVKILRNQLKTDTLGHAYLFCGTRGTGKTSTARILAKGVNCLSEEEDRPCGTCDSCQAIKNGIFMDVIEIDAASNNGVENIRELRESVKYPPVSGRRKVYIIDEVHMLSTGSFNALLKTLEEPPKHVMFILATTEPQKLPATILSRCLRLDFRRISEDRLRSGMRSICEQLQIKVSDAALGLIAANADGSVRDGLSLLDQCLSAGGKSLSREDVLEVLGTAGEEAFIELTDLVSVGKTADALLLVNRIINEGKDARQFMRDWIGHYRGLLMAKYIARPEDVLNMSEENVGRLKQQCDKIDLDEINESILELSKTLSEARWSTLPRVLLELAVVKLSAGLGNGGSAPRPSGRSPSKNPVSMKGSVSTPRVDAVKAEGQAAAAQPLSPDRNAEFSKEILPHDALSHDASRSRDAPFSHDAPPPDDGKLPVEASIGAGTGRDEQKIGEPSSGHPEGPDDFGQPEKPDDFGDLDELWMKVFEEGASIKGSFNLLRGRTSLTEIKGDIFRVKATSETLQRYAKANAQDLESLMEKHAGKKLKMECTLEDETSCNPSGTEDISSLANALGNRYGLNVEIE